GPLEEVLLDLHLRKAGEVRAGARRGVWVGLGVDLFVAVVGALGVPVEAVLAELVGEAGAETVEHVEAGAVGEDGAAAGAAAACGARLEHCYVAAVGAEGEG